MIRRLIKLQLKIALYPLKLALKTAGLIGDKPQTGPTYQPSSSEAGRDRYEPPPEPEVPQDIEVQAKDVLAGIKDGNSVVFVDVREAHERSAYGAIKGAVHIPLRDVPRRFDELKTEDEIVLYCAAGMRSFDAAMFLRDKGYDGAKSLVGGLPGWSAAGGEIVTG